MLRAWPFVVLSLAACSASPPSFEYFDDVRGMHVATRAVADASIQRPQAERLPRVGDRVAYELELTTSRDVQRWLVTATVARVPSGDARSFHLDVVVRDGDGKELGRSTELVIGAHLKTGPFVAAELVLRRDDERGRNMTKQETSRFLSSIHSMRAFMSILRGSKVLSPILWRIVRKPSIWSIVTNLGVKTSLHVSASERWAQEVPDGYEPAYRLPMALSLNGQQALDCSIVTVEPRRPISVGAGVVSLVARRPDEPDTRLRMRLIEALTADN